MRNTKHSTTDFFTICGMLLAITLAFVLASCSEKNGSNENSKSDRVALNGAASGTFTNVYSQTLSQACIQCHVPGSPVSSSGVKLDFTSQGSAYTTLTSSTVSGPSSSGTCGSVKIVDPGQPGNSYLLAVLIASYNHNDFASAAGCVPYSVHLQDQNISADEQASLIAWIQAGAANN